MYGRTRAVRPIDNQQRHAIGGLNRECALRIGTDDDVRIDRAGIVRMSNRSAMHLPDADELGTIDVHRR